MDSENTVMKYKSSPPYNKGRFFILFLIFAGFHILQASCRPEEAYTENDQEVKILISEGTTILGFENLHIASAETKKAQSQPKKNKKISVVKKQNSHTAENKTSKNKQNSKSEITAHALKHPSDSSFQGGSNYIKVGTITTNSTFKSAELTQTYYFAVSILYNRKFFYTYSFPFIKNITDRYNFTRPPPVVLS